LLGTENAQDLLPDREAQAFRNRSFSTWPKA